MSEQVRCALKRECRFLAIATVWCIGMLILGALL